MEMLVERITQTDILRCGPDLPLHEAARRMHEAHCSSILIYEGDAPVGIWTESDSLTVDFNDAACFEQPIVRAMSSPVKSIGAKATVGQAGLRFKEEGIRHLLVVDGDGKPFGIISQTDVVLSHGVEHYLLMREVRSALTRSLLLFPAANRLNEAVAAIRAARVDAAVVMGKDDQPVGIITERDLVRLVAARRANVPVGEVATRPLVTVRTDETLLHARKILEQQGMRHIGVVDGDGKVVGLLSFSDILATLQYDYVRRLEAALKERNLALLRSESNLRLAHKVIETSLDGIMICDGDGLIETVNPAFTKLTGYRERDVVGKSPSILSSGRHDKEFYRKMWEALKVKGFWQGEIWNRRKNGEVFVEWLTITAIADDHGNIHKYAAVFSDITDRKKNEEQIKALAYFDTLTGLPNRRLFGDRLAIALANAHRHRQRLAVMFLDLDLFKQVNDTLGHGGGDRVLVELAQRLGGVVREGDTVARVGGDEFVVLMPEIADIEDAAKLARRVIDSLRRSFAVEGREAVVTASIGVAIYPDDGLDGDTLVRNADAAMYRAKDLGRNSYQLYSPSMNARSFERLAMEGSLRQALEREELVLHYQPRINPMGQVVGVEALLRWHHPDLGLVPPADFLPLADDSGLIVPIGEWVLRTACAQARAWHDAGHASLRMAVNLSGEQFRRADVLRAVEQALDASGFPPAHLDLEVSTGALARGDAEMTEVLRRLRGIGAAVTIDNFGGAPLDMALLRKVEVDIFKFDRSFVHDIPGDAVARAALACVVALGQGLGVRVAAKGVETDSQLDYLRAHGCHEVQGYRIARPQEAEAMRGLLGRDLLEGGSG
jgi:diguanylate cyclase (GGDEF)-like protein/PAS domain S-box-containing protein